MFGLSLRSETGSYKPSYFHANTYETYDNCALRDLFAF
jgi:hypothetical protein